LIHGRAPLQPAPNPDGYIESAIFAGEPVHLTAIVSNAPNEDDETLARAVRWTIDSADGKPVSATPSFVSGSGLSGAFPPKLAGARSLLYSIPALAPGRYVVRASWHDDVKTEPRILNVYGGNEGPRVRQEFLRLNARKRLQDGTPEAYLAARTMLEEAAKNSTEPAVYEELADVSAPWASPEDTATYYSRSLEVAKRNLEAHYGESADWPESASELYRQSELKAKTFRDLIPYYKTHFHEVRVVVVRTGDSEDFAIERRKDGVRIRLVEIK
ncbi:MAG: hypothetical protein NDJ92_08525, partial [Thermoanaerobaculia bacterium]|nr:hypothetical protein [Thermoanaerobaculia bacterium]